MLSSNIKDVTKDYEAVSDLSVKFNHVPEGAKYAFLSVFNNQLWQPIFWTRIDKNSNRALFKDMGRGVVYLPQFYTNGKLIPAHNPIKVSHNGETEQISNSDIMILLKIPEKAGYLVYRQGKDYSLYHWNRQWDLVGQKTAESNILRFNNLSSEGLYTLVPEYSETKERIFTINRKGELDYW
jgi:hypothetical protein